MGTWWATFYGDHQMLSLAVRYAHVAALMVGGGTALAIDRLVIGAARKTEERKRAALTAMQGSHKVVVPALVIITLSGVLMAAADWSTFVSSRLFWMKMVTFVLLVINGAILVAAERRCVRTGDLVIWHRVVTASFASLLLWLLVLWIGEWLTVAA